MKLVNLTPHDIVFYDRDDSILGGTLKLGAKPVKIVPPSGTVCRVSSTEGVTGMAVHGVPVCEKRFSYISGLPEPEAGTLFIVSAIVAIYAGQYLRRADLVTVNELVRNSKGAVMGCCSLCRLV